MEKKTGMQPKKETKKPKQHKCGKCDKVFPSPAKLARHDRTHTGEKNFKCDTCSRMFSRPDALKEHQRTHEKVCEKQYECPTCHTKFNSQSLLRKHQLTHTTVLKPYSCDICGRAYMWNYSLLRHKISHTGERAHVCDTCGRSFVLAHSLELHSRTHSGAKNYICDICNQSFAYNVSLVRHKRSHAGIKPHMCDYCDKRFPSTTSLKEHKRTHTGEKPYNCETCGKAFATKSANKQHQVVHMRTKMPPLLKCHSCHEAFHQILSHRQKCPDAKEFSCNICGEKPACQRELMVHIRIHRGVELLKCHICDKEGFPIPSLLKQHVLTHSEERPYQCDLCQKRFHTTKLLAHHKRARCTKNLERPRISCDICHNTFSRLDAMKLHKKNIHGLKDTNNQQRSHKCNLCKRVFSTSQLLETHKQYHTGQRLSDVVLHINHIDNHLHDEMNAENPTGVTYTCFECGMEFELMKELVKHNEHHKIKTEPCCCSD